MLRLIFDEKDRRRTEGGGARGEERWGCVCEWLFLYVAGLLLLRERTVRKYRSHFEKDVHVLCACGRV